MLPLLGYMESQRRRAKYVMLCFMIQLQANGTYTCSIIITPYFPNSIGLIIITLSYYVNNDMWYNNYIYDTGCGRGGSIINILNS